jgi:hypothetical protein
MDANYAVSRRQVTRDFRPIRADPLVLRQGTSLVCLPAITSEFSASAAQHGLEFPAEFLLHDWPTPILQASFCRICLRTRILTFVHRIVGRLS